MSIDRLSLLGVTPEQLRQNEKKRRSQLVQGMLSAGNPYERIGTSIGLALGGGLRGLLSKPSEEMKQAEERQDVYGTTDFTDVNSILGSADVFRSMGDVKTATQYEDYAKQLQATNLSLAQDAEDRKRKQQMEQVDYNLKMQDLQDKQRDDSSIAPARGTAEDIEAFKEYFGTKKGREYLSSIQDEEGKGLFVSPDDVETTTPYLARLAADFQARANAEGYDMNAAEAAGLAMDRYLSGQGIGTGMGLNQTTQPDPNADVIDPNVPAVATPKAAPETSETTEVKKTGTTPPLRVLRDPEIIKVRKKQIANEQKEVDKYRRLIEKGEAALNKATDDRKIAYIQKGLEKFEAKLRIHEPNLKRLIEGN